MTDNKNLELVKKARELVDIDGFLHGLEIPEKIKKVPAGREKIEVRALRVGDIVHETVKGYNDCIVVRADPKEKWSNIEFTSRDGMTTGIKLRALVDHEIEVTRMVNDSLDYALTSFDRTMRDIFNLACKSIPSVVEVDASGWNVDRTLESLAHENVRWTEIFAPLLVQFVKSHEPIEDGYSGRRRRRVKMSFFEVLVDVVKDLNDKLARCEYIRSSSSDWSNLIEKMKHMEVAGWLRDYHGWERLEYSIPTIFGTKDPETLIELWVAFIKEDDK